MQRVKGVIEVEVDVEKGEVTVIAQAGKVSGDQLVEVVNKTTDSAHSFRARLKKGPQRKQH